MLPPATQTPPIQHGDHSDDELCVGPVDTVERTRKTIQSTQRNMLRLITQTRRTCRKKTKASNEEEGKEEGNGKNNQEDKKGKDGQKLSQEGPDEETEDGNDTTSDHDQDSDISFMNNTDEEIDTIEIEEEDWI